MTGPGINHDNVLHTHLIMTGPVINNALHTLFQALAEREQVENGKGAGSGGEKVLSTFMREAGEPITYIEARELWNNMRSTNIGEMPTLEDALATSSHAAKKKANAILFPS